MKPRFLIMAAVLLSGPLQGQDEPAPVLLPAERYAAMAAQSPFALATAAAPATTPQGSFAENWYVSGIARLGDVDFVTIKSRDATMQFSLFGREPDATHEGVSVASVNWSETIGKSTVILKKGTEMAKLEFNEVELRAPAAAAGTGGANAQKTPDPRRGPTGGSPGAKPMASPRPGVPPGVAPKPYPPAVNKALETRRRERIIPAPR